MANLLIIVAVANLLIMVEIELNQVRIRKKLLICSGFENYINLNLIDKSLIEKYSMSVYYKTVITLLNTNRKKSLTEDELKSLQKQIECHTTNFDEATIFNNCICLVKLLIVDDKISAMDYIKQKKYCLSEGELAGLNMLGKYTLEAIIIHVLGSLFNSVKDLPVVRLSTLIDHMDSMVKYKSAFREKFTMDE